MIKNINGFSIFINSEVPVSDLVINYKSNVPKWISIDINGNGVIDDNEYKFRPDKNGNLKIYNIYCIFKIYNMYCIF